MHAENINLADGKALIIRVLTKAGASEENARYVAHALVSAEAEGQNGHGFSRVAAYAAQVRAGKVNGKAVPHISHPKPAFVAVDAKNGFAYPALALAIKQLTKLASEFGIACAAISNSHHSGALGQQVEKLADAGLVGIIVANTPKAMAPWGGSAPLFGTNPIAFAAPVANGAPIVIDLSLSKVARGKVMAAHKLGQSIPAGWALDANGQPTTDPEAALAGTMLPAGGAKGAALALMVEVMAGALAGPNFSFEANSFLNADGPPPGTGQFLIALDPSGSNIDVPARIAFLAEQISSQEGARLPGSRRLGALERARREGLQVPERILQEIRSIAG